MQSSQCSAALDTSVVGHDPGVLTYTSPAAKKQARPQLPCYVPPEPDMQHMDSSAATFTSQGARYAQMFPAVFLLWLAHGNAMTLPRCTRGPYLSQMDGHAHSVKFSRHETIITRALHFPYTIVKHQECLGIAQCTYRHIAGVCSREPTESKRAPASQTQPQIGAAPSSYACTC